MLRRAGISTVGVYEPLKRVVQAATYGKGWRDNLEGGPDVDPKGTITLASSRTPSREVRVCVCVWRGERRSWHWQRRTYLAAPERLVGMDYVLPRSPKRGHVTPYPCV